MPVNWQVRRSTCPCQSVWCVRRRSSFTLSTKLTVLTLHALKIDPTRTPPLLERDSGTPVRAAAPHVHVVVASVKKTQMPCAIECISPHLRCCIILRHELDYANVEVDSLFCQMTCNGVQPCSPCQMTATLPLISILPKVCCAAYGSSGS